MILDIQVVCPRVLIKVKSTSKNLSIEFALMNYFHVCLNRALHTVSMTTHFQCAEVQSVGALPPLPSWWGSNTSFIFTAHSICLDYFAVSVFLAIEFL
jgi:hypothetical protein